MDKQLDSVLKSNDLANFPPNDTQEFFFPSVHNLFTGLAPRPILSISCDVHLLSFCLFFSFLKARFQVDWVLLVKQGFANIEKLKTVVFGKL